MNKQIIINGSHNKNGNTTKLIQEIYPEITTLKLIDYTIEIYNYDETYSDKDQFLEIINQILEFDEIIFATPVYWYSMSSLMKIFFDRLTDLIGSQETIGRKLMGKKVRVMTTSIGNHLDDKFFLPFEETMSYMHLEFLGGKHYLKQK
ncbi:flavodoxin family protein [Empedobacter tilapiae]|uniref:NADPH-dependent oxidoreductase n=1 Tax=Empedobacter tilapiae TaxID=2491114 RepID=A0A4Z1B577_9FLAO|nr:NAD(P)H-dependent oxidoreductase [Empedobacter tilapiae]TGN26046.1 NADPH-dependent oxidoreductase [Empedobacter tilapiae]